MLHSNILNPYPCDVSNCCRGRAIPLWHSVRHNIRRHPQSAPDARRRHPASIYSSHLVFVGWRLLLLLPCRLLYTLRLEGLCVTMAKHFFLNVDMQVQAVLLLSPAIFCYLRPPRPPPPLPPPLPPPPPPPPPSPGCGELQSKVGGATTGFDFSAGCTPVVLKGAHCPRGRLGGVLSRGLDAPGAATAPGVRAALEALEGRADGARSSGGGPTATAAKASRGEEERGEEGEERIAKVARLEEEIKQLRSENLRWQQVRRKFLSSRTTLALTGL